ncbi:MAG TPA: hypothetical protein VIG62_08200 [Blastocatellia bacterium]
MKQMVRVVVCSFLLAGSLVNGQISSPGFILLLGNLGTAKGLLIPEAERARLLPKPEQVLINASYAISKFNQEMVKEFGKIWRQSGNGSGHTEGVVLILRMADGTYSARSQGATNEFKRFTFRWHPAAIAIVHTHPNTSDPRPQLDDIRVADKYGVPVFTITAQGMYVYDPSTKKISLVISGVDWLDARKLESAIAKRI